MDLIHKTNCAYRHLRIHEAKATGDRPRRGPHPGEPQEDSVMRAALVLVLAVSIASWAGAATIDPVEVWRPMYPFIGTWKGTGARADGPVKVKRVYASAPPNHHLEI